jgi:branched-chain amino acid aminotransferase
MLWLDGARYDTTTVPFDVADRGLLLGDGLFDTSLVLGGGMVWRAAHVARLAAAARVLGFQVDLARLDEAIDALVGQTARGSLRITITRGAGPRGLAPPPEAKPTLLASIHPLRETALFAPLKLHVTAIRRNETSPLSRLKSLGYLDGVLATREARAAGCDDALFLNTRDRVACTSVGNLFALIGDQLVTPLEDDGVLPGIVRGVLLRTCDDLGLEPVERSLSLEDLESADDVLVTNSLRLVAPVSAIGRRSRPTPTDRAEALIAQVGRLVRDETGIDPRGLSGG